MHQIRNFVMRLSIHYMLLSILLLLRGISREQQLFGVWIVAFVFTLLTVTLRRLLLTLFLPLVIMTGGLFVFLIDGSILVTTAALTRLNINNFGWAMLGVLVMSTGNIWIERAFRALGWLRDDQPGQENVMTRPSPSRWLRITLLVLLLLGVAYSLAMAAQVFLATSRITESVLTMAILSSVAFALLVLGIAWLVAEGLALDRRARFSLSVAVSAVALIATPASYVVLTAPAPPPSSLPQARPSTQYWDLPTGSRIAYYVFPAAPGSPKHNPIIFLHDLGGAVLSTDITYFSQFSAAGYDVYLYDQAGCGLSSRLNNIGDYTISRHVEDLEAIRSALGADRLIIIAHAGGSEIAARYMIDHRDRVERVVFYSPTPLWNDEQFVFDENGTAVSPTQQFTRLEVRPFVAVAIAAQSPRTAQAYLSQAEVSTWADTAVDEGVMVCAGDQALAPTIKHAGFNPYVEIVGEVSANRGVDPRPALSRLLIPTILLRGQCDPVDPSVITQYQQAIPYLQVYHFEGAGSMIYLSRPDAMKTTILTFLSKETTGTQ